MTKIINRLDIKGIQEETAKRIMDIAEKENIANSKAGLFILEDYFNKIDEYKNIIEEYKVLKEEKENIYNNRSKGKKGLIYKKSLEKQEKIKSNIEEIVKNNPHITLKDISKKIKISYPYMVTKYSSYTMELKDKYSNESLFDKKGNYNG